MNKSSKGKITTLLLMITVLIGINYCAYADGHSDTAFTYSVGGDKYNQEFTPTQVKRESSETYVKVNSFTNKEQEDKLNIQVCNSNYQSFKNSPTLSVPKKGTK